mmetsp:Transcript_37401/g.60545  ORF Transcript_37401/g.60545 Transcript_37401/m.60545 type:complete len:340 (-) Transcript_37401:220-1239(-)
MKILKWCTAAIGILVIFALSYAFFFRDVLIEAESTGEGWIQGNLKPGASVAICFLGRERTLRTPYVFSNILRTIILPFGENAEIFASIQQMSSSYTWQHIDERMINYLSKSLWRWSDVYAAMRPVHLNVKEPNVSQWASARSPKCKSLLANQFFAMENCLRTVEERERGRGQKYDWIVRVRTDVVYREPFPIESLLKRRRKKNHEREVYTSHYLYAGHKGPNDVIFAAGRIAANVLFTCGQLYQSRCLPTDWSDLFINMTVPPNFPMQLCKTSRASCIPHIQLALKGYPRPSEIGNLMNSEKSPYAFNMVRPCSKNSTTSKPHIVCSTQEWKDDCCVYM